MSSRLRWLVGSLVISVISTVAIAAAVHPTWMKSLGEAILWGLIGSALFLLATVVAGVAVLANREAPMPFSVAVLLSLLLGGGVVWALLETVAVGL
jgi:hypothetical protein